MRRGVREDGSPGGETVRVRRVGKQTQGPGKSGEWGDVGARRSRGAARKMAIKPVPGQSQC